MEIGNCFECKHIKQGSEAMHCNHPGAIKYKDISEPCSCGRKPESKKGGCGACIGRGNYCYPGIYDECDCNGFEKKK
jgi:hypothetical protein